MRRGRGCRAWRSSFCEALVALALALPLGVEAGEVWTAEDGMRLRVGYSERLFGGMAQGANATDVRATTQVWVEMVIKQDTGKRAQATTLIYPDVATIERDVLAGTVDVLILLPQDYLEIRKRAPVVPALSAVYANDEFAEQLLLVRKGAGIKSVADLRGKRLILDAARRGSIPAWWLDAVLRRTNLPEATTYFGVVKDATKASQAPMAVFFGNADACVTARHTFEVVSEMNPQVGSTLEVLAVSPPFVSGIIAHHKAVTPIFNAVLESGLKLLHTHPTGRQLLNFFGVRRLIPFQIDHLRPLEDLLQEVRAERRRTPS